MIFSGGAKVRHNNARISFAFFKSRGAQEGNQHAAPHWMSRKKLENIENCTCNNFENEYDHVEMRP
jgi:hypothetical protein